MQKITNLRFHAKMFNMNVIHFATPGELREWFAKNHESEKELWVGYYKKETGSPTITWSESVDEALCYGWIDGVRKSVDAESYTIRFTPRGPKSIWSKINVEKVIKLTAEGRMTEAGLLVANKAKESGAWDQAYRLKDDAEIPEDFHLALKQNPKALENFNSYSNSNRFVFIYRIAKVKNPELRAQKIKIAIEIIKKKQKPYDENRKPLF